MIPASGTINEPSIIVHRRSASGNVPPLRVIKGPKVYDVGASGDVAPKRVIRNAEGTPSLMIGNPGNPRLRHQTRAHRAAAYHFI